jgi:hypothetical protein
MVNNAMASAHAAVTKAFATVVRLNIVIVPSQKGVEVVPTDRFIPAGLRVAKQTIANFIEKTSRLYEQKRSAVSAATALEMLLIHRAPCLVESLQGYRSTSNFLDRNNSRNNPMFQGRGRRGARARLGLVAASASFCSDAKTFCKTLDVDCRCRIGCD